MYMDEPHTPRQKTSIDHTTRQATQSLTRVGVLEGAREVAPLLDVHRPAVRHLPVQAPHLFIYVYMVSGWKDGVEVRSVAIYIVGVERGWWG